MSNNKNWKSVLGYKVGEKLDLCYKDHLFCTYYKHCTKGHNCKSALTGEVIKEANRYKLPIKTYDSIPEYCFSEINFENESALIEL